MKMLHKILFLSFCVGFASCTNELFEDDSWGLVSNAPLKKITISLPEIEGESLAATRTQFVMTATGVKAYWAAGDTIGIFPAKGDQVSFPITGGVETNVATFDGGDWGLKTGRSYAAYFPYDKWNIFRDNETILLDYTNQKQTGNNNADHLGAYDFLAAGQVNPNAAGYLELDMERLGCIVMLELVVPEADTYTSLTLTSSNASFVTKAELNISSSEPQVTSIATSPSVTLALDNVTLAANDTLRAYLMCAPVDLTGGALIVTINGSNTLKAELTSKNLIAGKPYKFSGMLDANFEIIEFADPEVKRICVENWDTNGNGELSTIEAKAVVFLEGAFTGNTKITSFNEFEYFTGLGDGYCILEDNAFAGCSSLLSISLPFPDNYYSYSNYLTIGYGAFQNCIHLKSLSIPFDIYAIAPGAFSGCRNLEYIYISGTGSSVIDQGAFLGCTSLTSIGIRGFETIEPYAFSGCTSLRSIWSDHYYSNANVEIKEDAFSGCTNLESVSINGISSIGERAFMGCSQLSRIEDISKVTKISAYAFQGCSSLTDITLSNKLTEICEVAFDGCSIYDLIIPESVTTIGYGAFANSGIGNVIIPPSVTSIEPYVFEGAYLESISLPEGLLSIGEYAFHNCEYLQSITIPESVTSIAGNVFEGCSSLTEIFFPENIEITEGNLTFQGCSSLESIIIPHSVTSIGLYAFSGCSSLESVIIPESVTYINANAFLNCTSLVSIVIPSGISSIEYKTFYGCSSLISVTLPQNLKSIGGSAFQNCSNLDNVILPNTIETLSSDAFRSCTSLNSIIIPESVTEIGSNAFWMCSGLSSITCSATTPPVIATTSFGRTNDCPLYVPASSVEAYKAASGWSTYASRIQPIQ